ncbi:hypothetical protein HDV03_004135 [Kappamyces sp. JEL0829]|nr:hypothetical protein HDV03_004135 [Kappamyces sp. JEL0829]
MNQFSHSSYALLICSRVPPRLTLVMANLITSIIRLTPPSDTSVSLPLLPYFIGSLVNGSQISCAVFNLALIYIQRLRSKLPASACGMACTGHRIALAAIIVAEKYVCDIPMKNSAWKSHARAFSQQEVNLMEKQFLDLLVRRLWC